MGRDRGVFVFGSCVSRDLLAFHPELGEVTGYIARQSWLSAERGWPLPEHPDGLDSDFQHRLLCGDFAGNAFAAVQEAAQRGDYLLLDLVDERLGIYTNFAGYNVTASQELKESAWYGQVQEQGLYTAFGEPEHYAEWKAAAARLHEVIVGCGAIERTIILAPDFAAQDEEGHDVHGSLGRTSADWNEAYAPYYQCARELGFEVLHLADVCADSGHQWGAAPFHYVAEVYAEMAHRISDRWTV
ncbi:MAG: DUF6270 domain-containing protein [Ancrocorticia sp.]